MIYDGDEGTTAFLEETKAFNETLNAYLVELQGELDRPESTTPSAPITLAVKDVQTKSQQKWESKRKAPLVKKPRNRTFSSRSSVSGFFNVSGPSNPHFMPFDLLLQLVSQGLRVLLTSQTRNQR